mgnify:CR=1 FL=1
MGQTLKIGSRIELVPMDPHCHDISIALYRQSQEAGSAYLVHTYSSLEDAPGRIAFVKIAMCFLGGMDAGSDGLLRFPCSESHELAIKRVFLEACKLPSDAKLTPRPLQVFDKKSGLTMDIIRGENGRYQIIAEGEGKDKEKRISYIAGGLMKLGQMNEAEQRLDLISFPCGQPHDAMLGVLLVRAPNVRAALREQEATTDRGVLAAPSQQDR